MTLTVNLLVPTQCDGPVTNFLFVRAAMHGVNTLLLFPDSSEMEVARHKRAIYGCRVISFRKLALLVKAFPLSFVLLITWHTEGMVANLIST